MLAKRSEQGSFNRQRVQAEKSPKAGDGPEDIPVRGGGADTAFHEVELARLCLHHPLHLLCCEL